MEVEISVMQLQGKESQGLPETTKSWEEAWDSFFLRAYWRNQAYLYFDLRLLAFRNWKKTFMLYQATNFVAICYGSPENQSGANRKNSEVEQCLNSLRKKRWFQSFTSNFSLIVSK